MVNDYSSQREYSFFSKKILMILIEYIRNMYKLLITLIVNALSDSYISFFVQL